MKLSLLLGFLTLFHTQTPNYSVWVQDSMTRVQTTDIPTTNTSVSLKMAQCETQSFQVAIRAPKKIPSVSIQPVPLWNGSLSIPASNMSWYEVGVLQTKLGVFPEVLLPVSGFTLPANTTLSMLVSITAPCDARSTTYVNTLSVKTSSGTQQIKLQAQVYPFSIPENNKMGSLSHFSANFSLADFDPNQYQQYGDFLLSYRMNPDNIWRNATPNPTILEHWYNLGLSGFNLHKADSAYLPNIDAFFSKLVLQPHGKELRKIAYFFGYDEKARDYLDTTVRKGVSYTNVVGAPDIVGVRANLAMLRTHYSDIPVYSTAHLYSSPWNDPMGDLDYYYISHILAEKSIYNFNDGETIRNTLDTSITPRRNHGYRSYFAFRAELQPIIARSSFWTQYQQKSDGFSYNMTNAWTRLTPIPPIEPKEGPFYSYTFADGYTADELVFYGTNGPLASMRMVNIRDGMEDYEYLWLLAQKTDSLETAREMAEQISTDFQQFLSTKPSQIQQTKDMIAGFLSQPTLSKHPDPPHRSTNVMTPFLSWRSDQNAVKYDVYLGDNIDAVRSAGWNSSEYKGRTVHGGWRPTLVGNHTYYWRVDAITSGGLICKGYIWKFQTGNM